MRPVVLVLLLAAAGCVRTFRHEDAVFQNAPMTALLAGCYSGTMSIHDLAKRGDFGVGTLDALDGEMIALDHRFFQAQADGKVRLLQGEETSPFATVMFFKPGLEFFPDGAMDFNALKKFMDERLPSQNLIYAVKVDGKFPWLKLRSAARQAKPFPVLTEAVKEQKVFELKGLEGTLVGFRFPDYVSGVNVPGYHFHFISKDRTMGGHVLDLEIENARIQIDKARGFATAFPESEEFLKFRFEADAREAVRKVEK